MSARLWSWAWWYDDLSYQPDIWSNKRVEELEAMKDSIKMVADGYQTVNTRMDQVADLLKLRVVMGDA